MSMTLAKNLVQTPGDPWQLMKFLAITFLTGIVKKPRLNAYWSTNELILTPFFHSEQCLSRDRFLLILKFLRFANYENLDRNDPICKISPFFRLIRKIVQNVYMPKREMSVDEILILFKGRIFFRQYIPSKKAKCGLKLYAACDIDGYMWDFELHTTVRQMALLKAPPTFCFTEKLVIHLMSSLFHMNYVVTCDNYFTSARLAEYLLENGCYFIGVLRKSRLPPPLKSIKLPEQLKSTYYRKGNVLVSLFTDRRKTGVKNVITVDTTSSANESSSKEGEKMVHWRLCIVPCRSTATINRWVELITQMLWFTHLIARVAQWIGQQNMGCTFFNVFYSTLLLYTKIPFPKTSDAKTFMTFRWLRSIISSKSQARGANPFRPSKRMRLWTISTCHIEIWKTMGKSSTGDANFVSRKVWEKKPHFFAAVAQIHRICVLVVFLFIINDG